MQKNIIICILCPVLLVAILLSLAPVCLAAEPADIVEETWTILEDDYLDSFGYLALSADPPLGFEGTMCLELSGPGGKRETIELTSMTEYIGGKWLPEGTYTVADAYVPNSDHFLVTCSLQTFQVSHEQDVCAVLFLEEAISLDPTLESIAEAFEPSIPSPSTEAPEAPTASDSLNTEEETSPAETSPEDADHSSPWFILGNFLALLVLSLFTVIIVIAWHKKKQSQRR